MEFTIIRTYYEHGTNGSLHLAELLSPLVYTIELPWNDNAAGTSCIPEGRYEMKMRQSERYGEHMILEGTGKRSLILIYPANNALKELRGCIAPVQKLTGQGKGVESRRAFEKLRKFILRTIHSESIFLTIKSIHYDNKAKIAGANTALL